MLYCCIAVLAIILSKILFRLEVNGLNNIPKRGGVIIASNHASLLDPIVLASACFLRSRKISFMAKAEFFRNKMFGSLISKINAFPINRERGDISAIKEAIKRLKDKKALLLFPEGSRSKDADTSNLPSGIGFLAKRTNTPILPTFVKGADKALPKGSRIIRPVKVAIYFGELYYAEKDASYSDIAKQTLNRITKLKENSSTINN